MLKLEQNNTSRSSRRVEGRWCNCVEKVWWPLVEAKSPIRRVRFPSRSKKNDDYSVDFRGERATIMEMWHETRKTHATWLKLGADESEESSRSRVGSFVGAWGFTLRCERRKFTSEIKWKRVAIQIERRECLRADAGTTEAMKMCSCSRGVGVYDGKSWNLSAGWTISIKNDLLAFSSKISQ